MPKESERCETEVGVGLGAVATLGFAAGADAGFGATAGAGVAPTDVVIALQLNDPRGHSALLAEKKSCLPGGQEVGEGLQVDCATVR